MHDIERRRSLYFGLSAVALIASGCGGGSSGQDSPPASPSPAPPAPPAPAPTPVPVPPSPVPPAPPAPTAWNVTPWPYFLVGSALAFDLSARLPAGVQREGSFGVDASGDALPTGMSLSAAGLLSVGSAAVGSAAGVVFSYTEPL